MAANEMVNEKSFFKGQKILTEGKSYDCAFIILEGKVKVFKVIDNNRVVLTSLGAGTVFGELGLINNVPASANVEAEEFCRVLKVNAEQMQNLLTSCPQPISHLVQHLCNRVRDLTEKIELNPPIGAFLALCQVLDLLHRAAQQACRVESRMPDPFDDDARGESQKQGTQSPIIPLKDVYHTMGNILPLSSRAINSFLERAQAFGLISFDHGQSNVSIINIDSFLSAAKTINDKLPVGFSLDGTDFIRFSDYSKHVSLSAKTLFDMLLNGDLDLDSLYVERSIFRV